MKQINIKRISRTRILLKRMTRSVIKTGYSVFYSPEFYIFWKNGFLSNKVPLFHISFVKTR